MFPKKQYKRSSRLAKPMEDVITQCLCMYMADWAKPRQVIVTKVKLSPDCRRAKVYVYLEGCNTSDEESLLLSTLETLSFKIKKIINQKLSPRFVPGLYYYYDHQYKNYLDVTSCIQASLKEIDDQIDPTPPEEESSSS